MKNSQCNMQKDFLWAVINRDEQLAPRGPQSLCLIMPARFGCFMQLIGAWKAPPLMSAGQGRAYGGLRGTNHLHPQRTSGLHLCRFATDTDFPPG